MHSRLWEAACSRAWKAQAEFCVDKYPKKDKIQLSDHFTYGAVYFPTVPFLFVRKKLVNKTRVCKNRHKTDAEAS